MKGKQDTCGVCFDKEGKKKETYLYGHIPSVDAGYPGLARFPIVHAPGHYMKRLR